MSNPMTDWKVGQEVYVAYNERRDQGRNYTATITKVARRWVYITGAWNGTRFDRETLCLDGGGFSSVASVYPDEATYEDRKKVASWFGQIRQTYRNLSPDVTSADVAAAAKLLRIELKEPTP